MTPSSKPEILSVLSNLSEVAPSRADKTDKIDKLPGPGNCPRCGAQLHPLADLVLLAKQISDRGAEGLHALDRMRLAIPATVAASLQEARLDGLILARRLACHAGLCERAPATPAAKATSNPAAPGAADSLPTSPTLRKAP